MKQWFLLALVSILFQRCASVQSPQGGPKDSSPPILLKTNPLNGEVNFKGKSIVLEYAESVVENDAKTPFISPLLSLTVEALGRKIRLTPDSGWRENQTYELRLNKKIKDEREGNIAADTSILFSTGNEPDRIQLQAEVQDLSGSRLSGKSTILLHAPNKSQYHSEGEGNIRLGGLKDGKYLIEVFQDKNDNLKYEEEDGRLYSDSIQIDSSLKMKIRPLPQLYKSIRYYHQRKGDTLQIECSRPIQGDSLLLKNTIAQSEDGTMYWMYPFRKNTIYLHQDSCGTFFPDTIEREKTDSIRSLSKIALKKKNKIKRNGKQLQIDFLWNWKVWKYPGKVEITKDSIWESTGFEKLDFGYRIKIPVPKPGKIKIRLDSISFYNKTGMRIDSITLTAVDLEEPGTISGTIETGAGNIVAELINPDKEVCARTSSGNFNWKVPPGKYQLQVFIDKNGDRKYTGGNRNLRRKAEPLFRYPTSIELKPGWDLENVKVVPVF